MNSRHILILRPQVYESALETEGHPSLLPFPLPSFGLNQPSDQTETVTATGTGTPTIGTPTSPQSSVTQSANPPQRMDGQDVFETVSLDAVPTNIASQPNHPVPRTGIVSCVCLAGIRIRPLIRIR